MTDKVAQPRVRSRGLKTWSAFGNLGRRPTEYEVLTHNLNHTAIGKTPLEMGPDVWGNRWLREHRDSIALVVDDWDNFRDPAQMTYGTYVAQQDDQETYVEGLLERFDADGYDQHLSAEALDLLARVVTPTRYVAHCQQMLSAYVQQLAISSYIANCAMFQAADELRRVQIIAYRTTQLKFTHPDRGFGANEKAVWTGDVNWQPIRSAFEHALVEFDWDRAFVATNLVTKAIADEIFLVQASRQLARVDAKMDELITDNLWRDAQRSRQWTAELVKFLDEANVNNRSILQGHLDAWSERAQSMIEAGARVIETPSGDDASAIASKIREGWTSWIRSLGLGVN